MSANTHFTTIVQSSKLYCNYEATYRPITFTISFYVGTAFFRFGGKPTSLVRVAGCSRGAKPGYFGHGGEDENFRAIDERPREHVRRGEDQI